MADWLDEISKDPGTPRRTAPRPATIIIRYKIRDKKLCYSPFAWGTGIGCGCMFSLVLAGLIIALTSSWITHAVAPTTPAKTAIAKTADYPAKSPPRGRADP